MNDLDWSKTTVYTAWSGHYFVQVTRAPTGPRRWLVRWHGSVIASGSAAMTDEAKQDAAEVVDEHRALMAERARHA